MAKKHFSSPMYIYTDGAAPNETGTVITDTSITTGSLTNTGSMTVTGNLGVTGSVTSSTEQTDYSEWWGLTCVINFSAGTWTTTRNAEADYVKRKTAAADTTIIGMDITPIIRSTASKGLKLTSFDVVYKIGTLALNAHTATLDKVNYANNAATTVTSVPLTGSLATATQANPYVTNIAVTTPAYDTTADSKYVLELTVNAQATSAFDFYGVMFKFSQNLL